MNMNIESLIAEDELSDLLLVECMRSTILTQLLAVELVGRWASRRTAKRRILLRSMSESEFRDDGGMYAEPFCSASSCCVSCLGAMSWMQGALNNIST